MGRGGSRPTHAAERGARGVDHAARADAGHRDVGGLEKRLAHPDAEDTADTAGKPPAGPVKSLTFRMGSEDDRLRIYWGDGTTSDLPCTKEQGTWACG